MLSLISAHAGVLAHAGHGPTQLEHTVWHDLLVAEHAAPWLVLVVAALAVGFALARRHRRA